MGRGIRNAALQARLSARKGRSLVLSKPASGACRRYQGARSGLRLRAAFESSARRSHSGFESECHQDERCPLLRIAVIPARGGSKRIPRKNIKLFAGSPMISYSIAAAFRSGLFDRIIVSTDDEEIAHVARTFGAEVPFMRPPELSDDQSGTTPVVAHAIRSLGSEQLTAVCCIYATARSFAPMISSRLWQVLESGNWQYVFAATSFAAPVYRSFLKSASGGLEMLFP